MKILQSPNIYKFIILIGIGIIIIGLIKGCQHFKAKEEAYAAQAILLDSMKTVIKNDSIDRKNILQNNADTIAMRDAELSLANNKLAFYDDTLEAANHRINLLLKRYIPIDISKDTSITTVPNSYIENCADCFAELESDRDLVKRAKAEKDNQTQILNSQINTQANTINKLNMLNGQLQSNLNNLISVAKDNNKKLEPTRKIYISLGAISINSIFPNGAGGGLAYQDKRSRMFAFRYYTSEYGDVKAIDLYMPLSFKR